MMSLSYSLSLRIKSKEKLEIKSYDFIQPFDLTLKFLDS